jgi:hypothetical protein
MKEEQEMDVTNYMDKNEKTKRRNYRAKFMQDKKRRDGKRQRTKVAVKRLKSGD